MAQHSIYSVYNDDLLSGNVTISASTTPSYIYNGTGLVFSKALDQNVNISGNGIQLNSGADIVIDNFSLRDSLEKINERLAILHVNPDLESRWEELRAVGEKYRQLEAEIMAKEKVWSILKT